MSISAPETTTKLPLNLQKDIENARANLDMLNSENTRQMNSYRATSKLVVEAETRLAWLNEENTKAETKQAKLLEEIATLTANKLFLEKQIDEQLERSKTRENELSAKENANHKKAQEIEKAELGLSSNITNHLKNHAQLQEDLKALEYKKGVLADALSKI